MRICSNCQSQIPDDAIFCDQCGARVAEAPAPQPEMERCPQCGAPITPGELFCGDCGAPLSAPKPGAEQAATATPAPPPAETSEDEVTCPFCGATVLRTDDFCFACGAAMNRVAKRAAGGEPAVQPSSAMTGTETSPSQEPSTEPPTAPPDEIHECPSCGASVIPGEAFCEYCGAALITHIDTAEQPLGEAPTATQPSPTAGRPAPSLVVTASGIELPVKTEGETVVGREDPVSGIYPDIDLTPHGGEEGGVSRRHLKIQYQAGSYMIEDLNSTNFTMVNGKGLQPGVPVPLEDGDEIRAGRVALSFRLAQ